MKLLPNRIIAPVFALSLALITPQISIAAEIPPVPTIQVNASGTAHLSPDMAVLTLRVVREAKTAREALDNNNKAMKGVLTELESQGIEKKDLQTSNFSIQPLYTQRKTSANNFAPPQVSGYRVSNALTVRVRDLPKLGGILDLAVTLGINSGGNVRFTNDDPSDAITLARTRAMKNATAKARTLIEAADAKLGTLMLIRESSGAPRAVPIAVARSAFQADAKSQVPIAKGENSYSVTIEAMWKIE